MELSLDSTEDVEHPCHSVLVLMMVYDIALTHFSDFLHPTYLKIMHFKDRLGPNLRLASCKITATT